MKRVMRFVKLTNRRKLLLVRTALLVAWISVLLRVFPRWPLRALSKPILQGRRTVLDVREVYWAVSASSEITPGATCLVRAIVACVLLKDGTRDPVVRIGVRPNGKSIQAHAWVELRGDVLFDPNEAPPYLTLQT